jgi:hypothetical protein
MAHPHSEHRAHKVEKRRVPERIKGYASGGAVHEDEKQDKKLVKRMVKKSAIKIEGEKSKHRMDRRARGGRTKSKGKGTVVNVINTPGHAMGGAPGMMPPGGAPMPPRPPMAPPMPPPQGAMPPGGGMPMPPPGAVPIRAKGGRISSGTADPSEPVGKMKRVMSGHPMIAKPQRARGGSVKDGPAWKDGNRNGTQVQHADGKSDGANIGRGRVVTFWAGGGVKKRAHGGKVESPEGVAPATEMPGGGGGAKARLFKERRAARDYAKA